MEIKPIVIPYDVSMQYIHGHMKKIYHEFQKWGNEVVVIVDGEGIYKFNDISFPVSKGDIFVLRGDYVKEIEQAVKLQACSIYYREEAIQRLAGTFRRLQGYQRLFVQNPLTKAYSSNDRLLADEDLLDDILPLIDRMIRELKLQEPGYEQVLNSTFFVFVTFISRAFEAKENFTLPGNSDFMESVVYLQSNYNESPCLAELARISHLSERQYNRKFKDVFGVPPSRYLMQLKLGRACLLLEESQMTISDIAMDCGFCDINYFSKCFRTAYSMTPTSYRKVHRRVLEMTEKDTYCLKNIDHTIKKD